MLSPVIDFIDQGLSKNWVSPLFWCDESCCGYMGPSWYNLKVDPEIYGSFGSYKLLVSNVAHQMNEKSIILNLNSS